MCWDWEPLSEGRQGEDLAPSHPFHLCRELTEINRRHITESVNSIRRLEEAQKQRHERLVAGQQQVLQQLVEEEPKVRPGRRHTGGEHRSWAAWPLWDTHPLAAAGPADPGVSGTAREVAPGDSSVPAGRDIRGIRGRPPGGLCQQWSCTWE